MTNRRTPDLRAVLAHPMVQRLWADTVEQWEAGRALSGLYNVHTGTLTGDDFSDSAELDLISDPERPPLKPQLMNSIPAFA